VSCSFFFRTPRDPGGAGRGGWAKAVAEQRCRTAGSPLPAVGFTDDFQVTA
jgi:hypothetical protein